MTFKQKNQTPQRSEGERAVPQGHDQAKEKEQFPPLADNAPAELKRRFAVGTTLCRQLQSAIEREQTKQRRRLIRGTDLRPLSPLRIYQDVHRTAERSKASRPAPTVTRRIKILQSLLVAHPSNPLDASSIEQWVWCELGAMEDREADELLRNPDLFSERLEATITELLQSKDYEVDKKGGRRTDPRLDSFIFELAFIYRAYTGFRATYSLAADNSGQQSPFFWFAAEVLRLFFQDGEEAEWATRHGALQIAIRRVSQFEGGDEPISDEALVRMLGPKAYGHNSSPHILLAVRRVLARMRNLLSRGYSILRKRQRTDYGAKSTPR